MTTDTDATAARLRRELQEAICEVQLEHEPESAADVALDTLIQYHRSVAARDALRDGELALWHPKDMRDLLEAAQARLALLEQEAHG